MNELTAFISSTFFWVWMKRQKRWTLFVQAIEGVQKLASAVSQ